MYMMSIWGNNLWCYDDVKCDTLCDLVMQIIKHIYLNLQMYLGGKTFLNASSYEWKHPIYQIWH